MLYLNYYIFFSRSSYKTLQAVLKKLYSCNIINLNSFKEFICFKWFLSIPGQGDQEMVDSGFVGGIYFYKEISPEKVKISTFVLY